MAYTIISQNNTTTTLADENGNVITVPARVTLATSTDYTITKVNNNSVDLVDGNGKVIRGVPACVVLAGEGGGGGDQHNLGYYATQAALEEAHPTAEAGDWAIVGATDTVWIWDEDTSAWKDSDTKGQVISVAVNPVSVSLQHLWGEIKVGVAENNRRFTFSLTEPGLYEIMITASDEEGNILSEIPIYKALSYSEEYDALAAEEKNGSHLMEELARNGGGTEIDDPVQIFGSFRKTLTKTFDPRVILIIVAIVLMLLDIAVRKFKFKWIHEIIKERKDYPQQ